MPIKRKPEEGPQMRSIAKGFIRLAVDLCTDKIPVRVSLSNGAVHSGVIVQLENDAMGLDVPVDRFNMETIYIPMHAVISIAVGRPSSDG